MGLAKFARSFIRKIPHQIKNEFQSKVQTTYGCFSELFVIVSKLFLFSILEVALIALLRANIFSESKTVVMFARARFDYSSGDSSLV